MLPDWGRLLPTVAGAACLTVAIAACSHDSPVAPATAAACAYVVSPTAIPIPPVGGTFQVSVNANAAAGGCLWTASTSAAWIRLVGATSGQGAGVVAIAVDGAAAARQGTVTVSWAGGNQSIAVTQCNVTQTVNLSPEGQEFSVGDQGCGLSVSSGSVDVPWISLRAPQSAPHQPNFFGIVAVVSVNTGPERIGHLTTPFGQVTVIQRLGNCVTALAPTFQAFDENGGAGSISVTAVPGCAWDATTRYNGNIAVQLTPSTAHGIGSGVLQFTVAANKNTLSGGSFYLIGGSWQSQINQSACPVTVSPLSFHVPAAAADYVVSVRVTGAISCDWSDSSNNSDIIRIFPESRSGSGDVRLIVTQNQTGTTRSGAATVADQTVVVTQDP
jgi:hypothetical protein